MQGDLYSQDLVVVVASEVYTAAGLLQRSMSRHQHKTHIFSIDDQATSQSLANGLTLLCVPFLQFIGLEETVEHIVQV